MNLNKRVRKYVLLLIISIPVFYSIYHAIFAPDFLARGFNTDVSHDYFYNGLLILDRGFPQGNRHPGTPLFYLMALIQSIYAGGVSESIAEANIILKIGTVSITFLSMISLYFAARTMLNDRWLFSIVAILTLYSIPSTFYYTTQFGPDLFTPALTLTTGFLITDYLIDNKGLNGILIGSVTGIGLAIKLSFIFAVPPIIIAILIPVVPEVLDDSKNLRNVINSTPLRNGVEYSFSAVVTFLVLTSPDIRNYPSLFVRIMNNIGQSSGTKDYIVSNIIYFEYYLLISSIILGVVLISYYEKEGLIKKFTIQFWGYFMSSFAIFILNFSSVFSTSPANPVDFRQISVAVIGFTWICALLITELSDTGSNHSIMWLGNNRDNIVLSLIIILVACSGLSLAYSHNIIQDEYSVGVDAKEVTAELEAIDGRIAVNQRGVITNQFGSRQNVYGPSVNFHLHGNEHYGQSHFTPELIDEFPDFTRLNVDYARSLSTDRNVGSLYEGSENNIRVTCLIYPANSQFLGSIPTSKSINNSVIYNTLAHEAGFKNYNVSRIVLGENKKHLSDDKFMKICEINSTTQR